jgi:hypothetical protein
MSSSLRPLSDNAQYSQQKNIHALGGIRTHNTVKWVAADLRFRLRGHWDRLLSDIPHKIMHFLLLLRVLHAPPIPQPLVLSP